MNILAAHKLHITNCCHLQIDTFKSVDSTLNGSKYDLIYYSFNKLIYINSIDLIVKSSLAIGILVSVYDLNGFELHSQNMVGSFSKLKSIEPYHSKLIRSLSKIKTKEQ